MWRAILLLGGPLVHAYGWLPPTPLFRAVELLSQSFRMGVFFAISGYLTALVLERRNDKAWLSARLFQLGVPALFGIAVLCPLVWLLVITSPGPIFGDPPLPFQWQHLWFLYGLMGYSVIAVAMSRIDRRLGLFARLSAATVADLRVPRLLLLITALLVAVLFAVSVPLVRLLLPERYVGPFAMLQVIIGYLPMFLLGFVLRRCDGVRAATLAAWRVPALIVALALVVELGVLAQVIAAEMGGAPTKVSDAMLDYVRFVGAAICPPAAFVLILRSALAIRRVPAVVRSISQAAFTIYVLHLPIAVAITTRLGALSPDPYVRYAVAVLGAGLGAYAFHQLAVRRSPTLALLLNGVPLARPATRLIGAER